MRKLLHAKIVFHGFNVYIARARFGRGANP